MRKQTKQFLQRSLCGILSAAMILTGSIIPDLSVFAAPSLVEDTEENADVDMQVNETPSEENKDAIQNPDAEGNTSDGNESSADGSDSSKESTEADSSSAENEENRDAGNGAEENGAKDDEIEDDDMKDISDGNVRVAETSDVSYADQPVTLNYYVGDVAEGETVGFYIWGSTITVDTETNPLLSWKVYKDNEDVYEMKAVDGQAGWYNISFKVTDTLTKDSDTGAYTKSLTGFNVLRSSDNMNALFKCDAWNNPDIYVGLLEGEMTAVKDSKGYADIAAAGADTGTNVGEYTEQEVSLNFYVGELTADETVGLYYWTDAGGAITIDTGTNPLLPWGGWGDASKNPVYEMKAVDGHTGWYQITFKVTDKLTLDAAGVCTGSLVGFHVIRSSKSGKNDPSMIECSGFVNPEIYTGLLDGSITAVIDGKGYADIDEAEAAVKEALAELVAEAKKLKEEDYKAAGWAVFSEALIAADEVLVKNNPTIDEIKEAYDNLEKAMKALVPNSLVEAEINVKPVALTDDFILGADISSYYSLKQSGTVFKDEDGNELDDAGFFRYLHDGGTNWIRIRVWNDPYDSAGNGYGGGNNDLEKAKSMGKLATDAGMKVLIDFHYSDFWADPGKQKAPKLWASMSVDEKANAVEQFTEDSLKELLDANVDVGMVQIGNETTNGICGVLYGSDGWAEAAKIYNAGSKAVRNVASERGKDILVAIHFTNPERSGNYANFAKQLNDNNVDYDVFASSYYPYWHGTTENLTSVLANVAKTYGKKVMVAETSWATTLDDQDGHDNTVRVGQNDSGQPYAFTVQGQADEIRAVVEAANNVNSVEGAAGSSIGVFYWEAAWLSPNYVYNEDGTKNEELYNKNKEEWEKNGSGWASSYAAEYDPEDAGRWFGGSAVDNQAWFGFDGTALPTAKIYSYIRTGAEAEKAVSDVVSPSITINVGETVAYPEKVTVNFNDGTSAEYAVTWQTDDQAKVDAGTPGEYKVKGIVTCEYTLNDGTTTSATKDVILTITVNPVTVSELINPGFEDEDMSAWVVTGSGTARKNEDPHSGDYGVHFYNTKAVTSTVMQTIENLDAGTYVFGGYIQGDSLGTTANAVVKVYDSEGNLKDTKTAPATTAGWAVWQNPEIKDIDVSEGDYLEVGMEVNAAAAGWGTIDDFYLYATEYGIVIDDGNKNGTLSGSASKSAAGETITITATPKADYILTKLTLSGKGVKNDTLTSSHGTVVYDEETKTAVLTYADKVTSETTESFIMPNSMVKVSAVFRTDVDLTALDQLIAEYDKVVFDGYTEESWKTFTDALEAAKAAAENVDAKQDEIDSAKEALKAAYNGLTKAPTATAEEIAALTALITEYEKVTNDGYTEESWKNFTDALAAAKAAVEKEGATTTDISRAKEALEKAHKELTKEATGEADLAALNALIAQYEKVTNDGYTEASWKNFTDALAAAKTTAAKENVTQAEVDSAKAALEAAYNGLTKTGDPTPAREGLWAEWTDEWAELLGNDNTITYTGKAIKPTVRVYDGETLLTNKSYSVSYKNNTKVGTASVIIKGKGNYTGSYTMTFNIDYVDLENDSDVSIADLYVAASKNSNPVSVKPVVTWKGKKVNAKLYEVVLTDAAEENAYVAPGVYDVEVKAKENNGIYKGSRMIKITLANTADNAQILMSSVKVKFNVKSKQWVEAEDGVTLSDTDITVTYKNERLLPDENYELHYENNKQIGTATVIIKGTGTPENGGRFVGELRKTFKITGTAIKARDVKLETGTEPIVYDGTAKEPTVTIGELEEGNDYTVVYQNNVNAGKKATAIITGINGYSGTVKKTFAIAAHDVNQEDISIVVDEPVAYEKGGSKPPVTVEFDGRTLVQGTDYTVSYTKNTKVTADVLAEAKITGKGNFAQKKTVTFAIGKQSLNELTATAADQTSAKKWNKVNPVITDLNGKNLKKGTDYDKTFTYVLYDENGNAVTDTVATPPAAGMRVEVTATGRGNYEGTITASYRIIDSKQSIAKARITVAPQIYSGEAIELQKSDITLEMQEGTQWKVLNDDQYEIVGYSNNINKGKSAKVTIHALAPYGGTKTFKFEIKAQSIEGMSWAERIASMFKLMFN